MKLVIQQEKTGCAIASSAALAGISYKKAKSIANGLGVYAEDSTLWSETHYIRKILKKLDIKTSKSETLFRSWEALPERALLAIKWHMEKGKPYWHWVVYVREKNCEYVLDSSKRIKNNKRTDFGRIKPKWYIKVNA
jgi:ABC-type bacteriocin/lantibiotic exporter with double-glycine peptidase domain